MRVRWFESLTVRDIQGIDMIIPALGIMLSSNVTLKSLTVQKIKTTVKVSGMACTMCGAHINEAIRGAFSVKKVKSNHSKGETIILSEEPLDEAAIRRTIEATGYTIGEITSQPVEKTVGIFDFIRKKL